ncbi:unnamed protein product [Caenorhabditis sp. 36 PRJEB53466]|nr:unnamed protein product [Caenorhabditis sp. 36 PRJEB53466]
MLISLIVYLCLSINLHAEHIGTRSNSASSTSTSTKTALESSSFSSADAITSSSSLIDVKEELVKIATTYTA